LPRWSSIVATFLIFLREGLEGAMIVSILLAYLTRAGAGGMRRLVWLGVMAAVLLAFAGGVAAYVFVRHYDGSRTQGMLEGATYLVAAGVLTYMTLWMKQEGRTLRQRLGAEVDALMAGDSSGRALALLAFVTVLREGLETVVFTLAIALSGSGGVLPGAVAGLAAALFLAYLLYRAGVRLNLALFFTVVGSFLMFSAAGLLADAVEDFQSLGWVRFGSAALWHTGRILPEGSFVGDLLHSFLGYAAAPSALQVGLYGFYLVGVLFLLWRRGDGRAAGVSTNAG
jgi:high-affinity iron transporter